MAELLLSTEVPYEERFVTFINPKTNEWTTSVVEKREWLRRARRTSTLIAVWTGAYSSHAFKVDIDAARAACKA